MQELYAGVMPVTEQCCARGLPDGRPRDLMVGDNLLDIRVQNEVLSNLNSTNPYCVIVGFPCDFFRYRTCSRSPH